MKLICLLIQDEGMPKHTMLEQFREDLDGVLFGIGSFWISVEVPGEVLSNVVVTRLPFAVPDAPVEIVV